MAELLNPDALQTNLNELEDWHGDTDAIHKTYQFADFAAAIAFVNLAASVAERLNHHPDIDVRWNKVTMRITSHSQGGVTEACVELARDLDAVATG